MAQARTATDDPRWAYYREHGVKPHVISQLSEDYDHRDRFSPDDRDNTRIDHRDFAAGWVAALVRYGVKAAFTDEDWKHFSGGA
jgi:hypothetical protein